MTRPSVPGLVPVCPGCGAPPARASARFCRSCGGPLPAAATRPAADPAPDVDQVGERSAVMVGGVRDLLTRPRLRRRAIIAGVIAAVVLLGGGAALVVRNRLYSPDEPIRAMFAALQRRDPAAIRDTTPNVAGSPLITAAALRTGYDPPTGLHIGTAAYYAPPDDTTHRSNRAVVAVPISWHVAGRTYRSSVRLERGSTGWTRPWRILDGVTQTLSVPSQYVKRAQIGGATVATDDGLPDDTSGVLGGVSRDAAHVDAPLGRWRVALPSDRLFRAAGDQHVVVTGGEWAARENQTAVKVKVSVRSDVIDAVRDQVRDTVTSCARSRELVPDGCPFGDDAAWIYPEPVTHWTIDRQPDITLVPDPDPVTDEAPIAVRTVHKGEATARYRQDGHNQVDHLDIDPGGTVALDKHHRPVWSIG